jgi:saccharopine dehydrogenase (NAD+, L-lysine-forming)
MIAAKQLLTNPAEYRQPGVWNIEQLNPDPFMADLNAHGLPWIETHPTSPLPGE